MGDLHRATLNGKNGYYNPTTGGAHIWEMYLFEYWVSYKISQIVYVIKILLQNKNASTKTLL